MNADSIKERRGSEMVKTYTEEEFSDLMDELLEAGLLDDVDDIFDLVGDVEIVCEDEGEEVIAVNDVFKNATDFWDFYYNPKKKAFTIVDSTDPSVKATVKKHGDDPEDMEKAMLYCLFKFVGIKPSTLFKLLKRVKIQESR